MTNEIVFIGSDGQAVTTSLAIAEGTEIQHKNILELIRKNPKDFQDFGPVAFETRKGKPLPQGGFAKSTEVAILNEQQATLLLTYMRNNEIVKGFKKHLVKSFFDIREKLRSQMNPAIPQTLPEALRLAADLAEKNQKLLEEQKINAPKVEFTDRVVADNNAMTITKAAKLIGYPPRKFKDYIRQIGWLYSNADTPMQHVITSGYMVLRYAHWTDNDGNYVEKPYAHITAKGMFALHKRMKSEGLIEPNSQFELAV